MKQLCTFSLIAALLTGACGAEISYSDVTVINPSRTLYLTLDEVDGAALEGEDDFNTSCHNPYRAIEGSVADSIAETIASAYEEDFGVVHICAGIYETEGLVAFDNLGSITIEGDGASETIISGSAGPDHSLLAMVPTECLPEDEPCPSYFNLLTLKDLTLTQGVGGEVDFTFPDRDPESEDLPIILGGAVTAPLVKAERVVFSSNTAPCGGAIATYGWTQLFSATGIELESAAETIDYFSSLIRTHNNELLDSMFRGNSALIGGAMSGMAVDDGIGSLTCLNTGPLHIVNSTFIRNKAIPYGESGLPFAGGAIATANPLVFLVIELGLDSTDEDLLRAISNDVWLNIEQSTFTQNEAPVGGAVVSVGKTLIDATSFVENRATQSDDSVGEGGALTVIGILELSNSHFTDNYATRGGAISLQYPIGGEHALTRNTFTQNVAVERGGAISGWTASGSARGNRFVVNRAPVGAAVAVEVASCSRTWSRREARYWRGNTFRNNRGGRYPVECYLPAAG